MTNAPRYEILALRYATSAGRLQKQNYLSPDDHAAPDSDLAFYVFAIRGAGRTIVVDTGFDPASGQRRQRNLLRTPAECLAAAGIDAATAEDVVLTHLHWDHAGGLDYFPRAKFHIQDSEMAFATGRCMCSAHLRGPFDVEHVVQMVRAVYTDRVCFHDPVSEIAPGVTLHHLGGHSSGLQALRVPTERGWVVLAGDASHLWANIRERKPFPIVADLTQVFEAYRRIEAMADGPDHVIPGHDPLILDRFAALPGTTDIACLHLAPTDR